MAINDFKPFATAAGANVMSQADYQALEALITGFQSGKASSAQVNKALRQATFVAAALAQYTANKSGMDVLDDGDVSGFITKMTTALGKDFQGLDATLTALAGLATGANKLPYFTGADTAAQTDLTSVGRDIIGKSTIADILTYLGLKDSRFAAVTSSQTVTVPDWVAEIYISGCAAGGGGGAGAGAAGSGFVGSGGGGGGAGQSVIRKKFAVTPGMVISVTIGAAGTPGTKSSTGQDGGNGGDGGNTVVGNLLTLAGGKGGKGGINRISGNAAGSPGGIGYPDGGYGSDSTAGNASGDGGAGGNSIFGGAGCPGRGGREGGMDGKSANGYGAGGGAGGGSYTAASGNGGAGGAGAPGLVIIEW